MYYSLIKKYLKNFNTEKANEVILQNYNIIYKLKKIIISESSIKLKKYNESINYVLHDVWV